jgi:hypothetical protein
MNLAGRMRIRRKMCRTVALVQQASQIASAPCVFAIAMMAKRPQVRY